jgi:hypothetical protein
MEWSFCGRYSAGLAKDRDGWTGKKIRADRRKDKEGMQ